MIVFKYSRKEAMKNKCYRKIAIEPIKSFILYCLLPIYGVLSLSIFLIAIFDFSGFFSVIIIFLALIGIPLAYALYFVNNNKWFTRVFILDDNKSIWVVEIFDTAYYNQDSRNDNAYIEILEKVKKRKKSSKGKALELIDLSLKSETKKYYVCEYKNEEGYIEQIKILKVYENIKEILRS